MTTRYANHLVELLLTAAILGSLVFLLTGCNGRRGNISRSTPVSESAVGGDADGDALADHASPTEELWVIAKPDGLQATEAPVEGTTRQAAPATDDATPGTGALVTTLPGEAAPVPVPLKHTHVSAKVDAYIATVDVQQQFHNPFESKIEAVYVFPLPQNAAVNEFVMTIGDRKIRGIIREREEAERIYKQARSQGHVASLLTQERPNIFTQKVANIEPGKQIDVNIKYFHTLAYEDGWYEFVFPMVVGPRFNPAGFTDGIGAVGRASGQSTSGQPTSGGSGQKTEVQYLKPNERSGHDIGLTLEIDAGVSIEAIRSVNHRIVETPLDESRVRVAIAESDALPNKDFVLRFQVAGETIKTNVLTHRDERGGFFTMVLYPPKALKDTERSPMEMIFVLDCSGSMNGKPIEQAKDAIIHGIEQLRPYDSFQVIRFSNNASQFGDKPVIATNSMKRKAINYVRGLRGGGGTMMIEGIKAALDFPHATERLRFVSFMTDGYIGNDRDIIGEVHNRIGESRIFSFGVGSSPNRYLMDRMAKEGRGAAAYLSLNDNGDEVMDQFFTRVSHPALTDIAVNFGGAQVSEVYPRKIPDLFVGKPVVITGRYTGQFSDDIHVTGRAGGKRINILLPVDETSTDARPSLPSVWARTKIADLYDQHTWDPNPDLPSEVRQTALNYQLMSAYTAFVAVDSLTKTAGNFGTTVNVPVPVPDGVRYDTTVTE